MELDTIADELYGLAPAEFTTARNAHVAAAKKAGDRELAAAVTKLRRPTRSAWLANRLVRERREQVAELLELGGVMRDAQEQLAGEDLRELSRRRRQLVESLARDGTQLGARSGETVTSEMTRDLEATLEAALADPQAGDAVLQGRLTDALSYSGFGLGSELVVGPPARKQAQGKKQEEAAPPATGTAKAEKQQAPRPPRARREGAGAGGRPERLATRPAASDATRTALEAAEADALAARQSAEEAADTATRAIEADTALRRRVADLEAELAELRLQLGATGKTIRAARREQEVADRAAASADARLRRARTKAEGG